MTSSYKVFVLFYYNYPYVMIIILTLIEKDHLGDCSPEKDCCW